MTSLRKRLSYNIKYTLGSYADIFISSPIWAGAITSVLAEKTYNYLKKPVPNCLSQDFTTNNSPIYALREKLRDSLDTKPGAIYLQSNIVSAIPFFLIGMPTAEWAQGKMADSMSSYSDLTQNLVSSGITIIAQMLTGYSTFITSEVISNFDKYSVKGKLNSGKVLDCLKRTVKSFLPFDVSYTGLKIAGQSWLLSQGKDPWKASGLFDSLALPLWYAVTIPLGLRTGLIETKKTKERDSLKKSIDSTVSELPI